jgi:hypothetical protein
MAPSKFTSISGANGIFSLNYRFLIYVQRIFHLD